MTSLRIQNRNEIGLNGHVFRINGRVQRQIANQFAEKTVIGDYSEASDPVLSQITWRDFSGGQGRFLFDVNKPEHATQFWTGNVRNDMPGHIVPQPGFIATPSIRSSAGSDTTQVIVDRVRAKPDVNVTGTYTVSTDGGSSHRLNYANSSLGTYTFRDNLASRPFEIRTGTVNGTRSIAIAESTAVQWTYTTPTSLFTDTSRFMKSISYWRNLLWGITNSGELSFSAEASDTSTLNWTDVAQAEVTDTNTVKKLTTVRMQIPGSDDRDHLVLVRNDGFDIYDRLTETFTPAFRLPASSAGGQGGIEWNGAFYYPYGLSLYQWTAGQGANQVRDVGLAVGEGVPEAQAGAIFDVAASPRQLFVSVKPTDSTEPGRVYVRTAQTGWTEFTQSTRANTPTSPMYVGLWPADDYVLVPGWAGFFPHSDITLRLDLNQHSIVTDSRVNQISFNDDLTGDSTSIVSPWIVADGNQDWNALKFSVDLSHLRSSIAVGLSQTSFALDYATEFNDTAWTNIISVNTSTSGDGLFPEGKFEARLPSLTEPAGVPFTSIRWRARWGVMNNNAYDLHHVSLTFQKRPKLRYAFSFEIDFSEEVQGFSPKQQREFLDEFFMQATLGEFTYHDEHPGGGQTYYVTPLQPVASEETGTQESGVMRMTVMEAV